MKLYQIPNFGGKGCQVFGGLPAGGFNPILKICSSTLDHFPK